METNRLRYFCLVAELENMRKAGEILGISHSALSKSLKILQEEVDQKLLIQNGRNIKVTEEGRKFLEKAKLFLSQEEILFKREEFASKSVRVGTYEVFSTYLLGSCWSKYFKNQELDLYELLPGQLERAILNRKVDFGITYEPIPLGGLEFTEIGFTGTGVYKRINTFEGVEFENLPFVAPIDPIQGTSLESKYLDGWPLEAPRRRVQFRVDMLETGLALARQGSAVIFIPHFIARIHNKFVRKEHSLVETPWSSLSKNLKRKIYLVHRANLEENAEKRKLGRLLRCECI